MELNDPMENLESIRGFGKFSVAIFIDDLSSVFGSGEVHSLGLDGIFDQPFEAKIPTKDGIICEKIDQLGGEFSEKHFSMTKYLFSCDGSTFIYDSPRENISILLSSRAMPDRAISLLDNRFREHRADVGIGFGKEGDEYFMELLEQANRLGLLGHTRFENLSSF